MKSLEISMKKTYKWLLLLTIILATNLSAQVASVTWPLTSTQNANTPIGNITALQESIGTGSGSYILSVFSPYVANGQRLWTGNQGTGWIAGLPDYTRYIQFDASPTSGNNFTVQYVSFNYSDNPLGVDFNILKSEVWYSTDGWNNKTQLNSTPLDYLNTSVQTFSKSMNVQVLNGQTFSVRIYPYAPNGGSARTQSWATHKNVIIEGMTSAAELNNGSICGMKFDDWDGNGVKDEANGGLAGWTINLSMGAVQMTATTGADGSYCFNNLAAGTYTLSETPQSGWRQTYPDSLGTQSVTLTSGQSVENIDFGNKRTLGSISGTKFNDINGTGDQQNLNEPGLPNWTINLTGPVSTSTTTDANGLYHFNNLPAGTYTVTETNQSGWQQIYPLSPGSYIVILAEGELVYFKDFANQIIPPQTGSICGIKFNDLNGDGRKDGTEPGLPGWTITLSMGAVQMTATTGADGSYCFNNLAVGTYTLSETQQSGWQQTTPASPGTQTVTLTSGLNAINIDFGNKQIFGSICGMKFNDLNGDGKKDGTELGLSGWTITLSMGAVQMTATTGSDGSYCFDNLAAGTYTLSETQQSGWQQTFPSSSGTHTITLTPGLNLIGINFGNKEILNPGCTDFENGTSNGWQVNNTMMSIQQNGSNHFVQTTDQSGASSFFNSSKPLIGNWTNLFSNGCGSLCFDVNFLYGGNPYNGVNPPQTFTPYIAIEGNGFTAAFITYNQITVGDGWHAYCAPLSYLNSDGTLPSNSDGYWVMGVGTANDWNTLLSNVTKVRLPVDPTSYQNEKFGYDNICLKNTGDCNSPLKLGSICGIKIHDKNGDGVKDANEDGIPNWTIILTIGTTTYTATTDANGNYCFDNLPAGTYTVSEANLPEWRQVFPVAPGTHTVTLLPGLKVTNINFSNVEDPAIRLGSICGIKFNDLNGDGDQDPGELGLPNWQFNLTGTASLTATTDLNGGFCFLNLKAGSYTISEVIQSGWKPTAPDTTGTLNISLLPGENLTQIYFGNKEILGSICGKKYNDLNGNSSWDTGEPGLPNWQITLSSFGYTSSGHVGGPTLDLISTITTDQNGDYCFNGLKPGSYLMGEIMQSGWSQTEPANGIYGITLTPGQKIEGRNFGNKVDVTVRLGSICGIKFNDKNGNGRQDDGELGIPDWQIQLGGPIDMTVVTDKNGNFCFENLLPGEYKVGEVMKNGWRQTVPSTSFYIIQLASGQFLKEINFGNKEDATVQLGSICGVKFNDKNGNGRQDDGELGISNWTIYLTGPMNLVVKTDDNGNFCFYGLIPGSYNVREENKVGWRQTKPSSITYSFEVGNGDNFKEVNFGNKQDATVKLGSICGMKFNDLNDNGRKDDGEPGIPDWTINLTGTMNLSTTTDSKGFFCFDNLKMGNYTVSEVNKNGWTQTAPSTGIFTIELTEDRNPDDLYFGNKEDITIRLGSICGIKFNDKNGNGRHDTGELGIPDWQINLGGPIDLSIKTDKEGKYCFDNLLPGTYIIKEEPRTDWTQTFPASPDSYSVTLTSGQNLEDYKFGNKYEPKPGCVQPPNGMVAWWSLDVTSRSKWPDFAGYNNFGTLVNGPIPVTAKVLGGLQFDGIDDYVEVADHTELNFGPGDFSFDAWIKTSEKSPVQMLVSKRSSTGYAVFLNSGYLGLILSVPSIAAMSWSPNVFVADGNWHHIALTVSRTNTQGIVFYLDGIATPYGDPTPYQGSLTNSAPLKIGTQQLPNPSFYFKGILDEIELFNRVLTQAEIVSIYNAGSSGKCKPSSSVSTVWGHVFHDLNYDGVINGMDSGLLNWTVFLNGPTIATAYTDVDGNFGFTDLKPGNYTISVAVQTGWSYTKPIRGNYTFEIAPDISIDALNFGFINDPCLLGLKTWSEVGNGLNNYVNALAVKGNDLIVGGIFTSAGGMIGANYIAKWNSANSSWSALGGGVNGQVTAIAIIGNDVFVGGSFTLAGGVSAKNIARWDGSNWYALGEGTNGAVHSLAMMGTDLYVGGLFTTAGLVSAKSIAKWNITSAAWSALGGGVTPQNSGGVFALAVNGTDLYVGGSFWGTGGANSAFNIIKWNSTNSSWSPMGSGLNNNVLALAIMNGELYAGGEFDSAGGFYVVNHIARWDNTNANWAALGSGSGMNGYAVNAFKVDGQYLYAGGYFTLADGGSANRVAYWDGTSWIALGNGMNGYAANARAIEIMGGNLYVGGYFTSAGNVNANNIAKYSCSSATTSVNDDKQDNSLPQQFQLSQNYPNPFNPTSTIRYDLPKASFVKISVYDILGREIRVLVNEEKNSGHYEILFDARELSSGVYFYTIRTRDYTQSKKMILMK